MMENKNNNQEQLGTLVREKAQAFQYPPTPDIALQVRRRITKPARQPMPRLAWAVAVLVLIAGFIFVVPQSRAALVELIKTGAVTLLINDSQSPIAEIRDFTQLSPLEEALFSNSQEITLQEAQGRASFNLAILSELDSADAVYYQDVNGLYDQVVVMIWRDEAAPNGVQTLFYQMNAPYYGIKQAARDSVRSVWIDGREAFWIEGAHTFTLDGEQDPNLVPRNVLVWTKGDITYRLESDLTFEQAVQMAESLEPLMT